MNIFKRFFNFLFKKKKESTEFVVEPPVVEESTMIEDSIDEEDEDKMREKVAGEVEKENKPLSEEAFTLEDKTAILDVIRPIIKEFNFNEIYNFLCNKIGKKTLKTFSSLSEDNYKLIITLTQSKDFNLKLNDFIRMHMIDRIQYALNDFMIKNNIDVKFKVESDSGSIIITKLR